jgi:hypothetical protein
MNIIGRSIIGGVAASILLFGSFSGKAVTYTMNLGENDPAGTSTGPGNGPPVSQGVIADNGAATHPPFVSGPNTLAYALSINGANQLIPGDVLIYEDAAHTILSDILRFENWGVGYVYVYSALDDGVTKLADNPFPTVLQANTISFTEQFNGSAYGLFGYTPTANQPGFSDAPLGGVAFTYAYDFTSDEPRSVPDGGTTAALLGLGLLAVGAVRRKLS